MADPRAIVRGGGERPVPRESRLEGFDDTVAPLFDTSTISPDSSRSRSTDCFIDDLLLSRVVHGPQCMWRDPQHHPLAGVDVVVVLLHLRGWVRGHVGDVPVHLDPDHVTVVERALPFTVVTGDVDVLWAFVPRRRLGHYRRQGAPLRQFHTGSPRGRVLRSSLMEAWSRRTTTSGAEAPALADQLADALRSVLDVGDFRASDAALALAARDHILDNLDDLGLDPNRLAKDLYCSRATLYRLFRDHGGVARYIRDRRLDRCLDELLSPDSADQPVGRIASRWGFDNPSHFHRLFTARFGTTPSAVKASTEDRSPAGDGSIDGRKIADVRRWSRSH